jgi:general secretion pathway protein D
MMNRRYNFAPMALLLPLLSSSTGAQQADPKSPSAPPPASAPEDTTVKSTVVEGQAPAPAAPVAPPTRVRNGDISLNFPSADVRVVAKAVLADILHVPYAVAPGLSTSVSVVTPHPIARASILTFLEDSLRASNLALISQDGAFRIESVDQAKTSAATSDGATGFGNEIVQLSFVNADEMKKLLDPVLPGVVSQSDASRNVITLSGTSGQRSSARDLLRQFDVNWLRGMSFALIVPQRTDSRIIVPELEKLINAPDAPTRGLVRLISMEKLNGILAVTNQRQYLDDVNRWIEILDRDGQNNERRLFVYPVQNSRSRDLARSLNTAFGNSNAGNSQSQSDPSNPFGGNPDGNQRTQNSSGNAVGNPGRSAADIANNPPPLPGSQPAPENQSGGGENLNAKISSDDNNNAIMVFSTPREYAVIEDALRKLDVPPVQVLIEAAITEVSLNDDLRYGLQWNFASGTTSTVLTDSSVVTNLVRAAPGFSFLFQPNNKISTVLNTIETKTKVNVISAPKLLVLNNQTAVLQVGDQVPIATQNSTATTDPNAPTINSIEYRDTGVILKVTPRVNGSGRVLLDVSQEVSDVKSRAASGSGINSPTISTRRISTTVAVQDGEVLVLGGLIRNTQTRDKIGIPFLSQIPVIGGAFGRHGNFQDKIELIVIIKPQVIRTIDDARAVTDEMRQKIRSLEPFKTSGKIP